jgi:hypothetical protein
MGKLRVITVGSGYSVCTYVENAMPSGKHRVPCTSIVELDMR